LIRWILSFFAVAAATATGFVLLIFNDKDMKQYRYELEDALAVVSNYIYPKDFKQQLDETKRLARQANKTGPPSQGGVNPRPFVKWIQVDHIEGWNGTICNSTNYTTVAMAIAPGYQLGSFLPMLELRGHRFDAHNKYAANAGFVGRYVPMNFNQILGFNVFYDWRQGKMGNYSQLGGGVEVLSKFWEFRANAYAPIGDKMRVQTCRFDEYVGGYVIENRKIEFVSYGFNAEFGLYLANTRLFSLYLGGGPYYLSGKINQKATGGTLRLRPQFKDYFAMNLSFRHDNIIGTVYQAEIIVNIPLYELFSKKGQRGPGGMYNRQVYQRVERFEMMPLCKNCCWKTNF